MTFAEFQATGRDVTDLSSIGHLACSGFSGAGRTYMDDDLCIERITDQWHLTIGNHQEASDTLEQLERKLYQFAATEGYL